MLIIINTYTVELAMVNSKLKRFPKNFELSKIINCVQLKLRFLFKIKVVYNIYLLHFYLLYFKLANFYLL